MNELEHFGSKNSQVEGREMQSKSHERIATERCQGAHSTVDSHQDFVLNSFC